MFETQISPSPVHNLSILHSELIERRDRLRAAAGRSDAGQLSELLQAVDIALDNMELGSYGICEICHDPIERQRLAEDPLTRVCLECLSATERRALEHDLELAASIQTRLLPRRDFSSNGWDGHYVYEPHGAVSGDFCDVINDGEDTLVLLGDISGKGVAAALLMSHLSAIFRGLVGSGWELVEVMARANRLFGAAIPAGSFATMVAARLMPEGEIEISNAGHVPPLYHNGRVDQLPPDGVPLGLFCESVYTSQRLRLSRGERLVLATDGLIESTDPDDKEFGIEMFAAAIAASPGTGPGQLAGVLVDEVSRFRRGLPATDDITLMVVRRTS
jgi:sigma-B regulation protein RsbU (phosphoserine phosphatase)